MPEDEEAIIQRFLGDGAGPGFRAGGPEGGRSLADIILNKIREKESNAPAPLVDDSSSLSPKVLMGMHALIYLPTCLFIYI